jgi:hypothetical protein
LISLVDARCTSQRIAMRTDLTPHRDKSRMRKEGPV